MGQLKTKDEDGNEILILGDHDGRDGGTNVIGSPSSSCPTSDTDCCDTFDTDSSCPLAWEYEDPCSCITDSDDTDYNTTEDENCVPCVCYNPAYPRSKNWD